MFRSLNLCIRITSRLQYAATTHSRCDRNMKSSSHRSRAILSHRQFRDPTDLSTRVAISVGSGLLLRRYQLNTITAGVKQALSNLGLVEACCGKSCASWQSHQDRPSQGMLGPGLHWYQCGAPNSGTGESVEERQSHAVRSFIMHRMWGSRTKCKCVDNGIRYHATSSSQRSQQVQAG